MHIVVFGLTVSSSWGNGHATLWRSLIAALLRRGHTLTFYERDVPYYARARDLHELPHGAKLRLYSGLEEIAREAKRELHDADLALWTSYCPDGLLISDWVKDSRAAVRAFYDMDTPVTLNNLGSAATAGYLPTTGLEDLDLVLSYTGGRALTELKTRLGAQAVAPLYGWVDPQQHYPVAAKDCFRSAFCYLGTYAADRQAALQELFLRPAAMQPHDRFLLGGTQYPLEFPWTENIYFARHLEPSQHPAFFCSSAATLNVTRQAMAEYGYCPSGRLFEATACGVPVFSDQWEGLDRFFSCGAELLVVSTAEDVCAGLAMSDKELRRMAQAARERTLAEHTADVRVRELEQICERARTHSLETAAAV